MRDDDDDGRVVVLVVVVSVCRCIAGVDTTSHNNSMARCTNDHNGGTDCGGDNVGSTVPVSAAGAIVIVILSSMSSVGWSILSFSWFIVSSSSSSISSSF